MSRSRPPRIGIDARKLKDFGIGSYIRNLLEEGLAHEAIGLAWRVLENDRAHEEAYRLLMRAPASLGDSTASHRWPSG